MSKVVLHLTRNLINATRDQTFYDAEAVVTGHTLGKGKNMGVAGALKCKMESGKVKVPDRMWASTHYDDQTFNVGTGLSDKVRRNPPKVGTIITYRFQELTKDGVPR